MSEKEILRENYKKIREGIPAAARKAAAKKIAAQALKILEFIRPKVVGVYVSKGSEVETHALIQALLKMKMAVAAPKVANGSIEFHAIKSLKDCVPGTFGVLEPKSKKALDAKKLTAVLVPGIVFDRNGYRLGYGKGFYDKFLSALSLWNTIGLTYDAACVEALPRDERDVPVNWLITESRTLCLIHEEN